MSETITTGAAHQEELPPGHYHHIEPEQAYHASKFGMWLFLATEVHLFGVLFVVFALYRWLYYQDFHDLSRTLSWKLGALNTAVLLTSSYFMVRAVDAAQRGRNDLVSRRLNLTLLCAVIFLAVKSIEYGTKFEHGIFPNTNIFFGLYYIMTGVHGLHVLGGMAVIIWLKRLARKQRFSEIYYTPVEVVGLYWHLVDIIWIFLFPMLYLIGGITW